MVSTQQSPRVLITAESGSMRFGGEALLPVQYFRLLRERGIEAWLLVHGRTQRELERAFPADRDRLHFVEEMSVHRVLDSLGQRLPTRIGYATTEFGSRMVTGWYRRQEAQRLVAKYGINVVHEPIPVSPREPSLSYGLGAPVVIGPMKGGMSYPPAFMDLSSGKEEMFVGVARGVSRGVHRLCPGKIEADTLLVANQRTRAALPTGIRGQIVELSETGVDPELWKLGDHGAGRTPRPTGSLRAIYAGRLAKWKGVHFLLRALTQVNQDCSVELSVVGDGVERDALEQQAEELGLKTRVTFFGWVPQEELRVRLLESDVLVLPSLYECGGAVILEAMASERPVLAADWGASADYVTEATGILVSPTGEDRFVSGLARGLETLARSEDLCRRLGAAGRKRVLDHFSWDGKIDRILQIYAEAIARHAASGASTRSHGARRRAGRSA